jgi:predicted amidohydrolase YtcJ
MTSSSDRADIVFVGGRVHTVDSANSIAEAVAVAGDRILATGSNAVIRALAGPGTRVVELNGRSLLPGFIDAHCHTVGVGASRVAIDCKAPGMGSIAALQEAVRQRAASQPPGTWIRGRGYDQMKLAEGRHPNRFDFDAVAPEHPVVFTRTCGHISVGNSKALDLAGISDDTPDPPGGRYDRDNGRNLGVCYELAKGPLDRVAAIGPEEIREALLRAQDSYLAAGGTSVHDAGGLIGPAFGQAQRLHEEGKLTLRIYAFGTDSSGGRWGTAIVQAGVYSGFGDDTLQVGAYKVVTDGSTSGPTGATRAPYASNSDDRGILYYNQHDLDDMLERAHRAGFQCTVHGVGDRAIESTLDAMARAQLRFPRENLRHRIEHCAILPPDLQQRVRQQGIVPAMQPAFFWEFGDGYIINYGRERADYMFPVKSLLDMGVTVAGSSDAPVTDYRPLFGIEQAQTRATMNGDVCGPNEVVDLTTAIRMHTINGAYASFEEQKKGSLEPGKLADIVVLSEDIARVPVRELRDLPVAMTLVGGVVAYEA